MNAIDSNQKRIHLIDAISLPLMVLGAASGNARRTQFRVGDVLFTFDKDNFLQRTGLWKLTGLIN